MKYPLLIAFLAIALPLQAAGFRPVITNYSPADQGFSMGSQIWSCSQDWNGAVYFATNKGLMVFDGYQWTNTSLPDKTIVRSVKVIGNRIYVGAYEDFGYFQYDSYGDLVFTSLRPLLGDYPMNNEEP